MKAERSVLVVDDDGDMREFCATALRLDGWQVEEAGASQEAESLLKTHRFDVVLSDFTTSSDAQGLTHLVKATQPKAEVVVMTGLPSLETALSCFAEGAHDYLVKPFHHEQLLASVRRCLEACRPQPGGDARETAWLKPVMRAFIQTARARRELPRLPALLVVDEKLSRILYHVACELRREGNLLPLPNV